MRMHAPRWIIAFLVALLLAGCASVPAPESPRQQLAYAEGGFTAVVETLTTLRAQGILSADQVTQADALITRGNAYLGAAHTALASHDTAGALGKVAALNSLLVELRGIIQEANHG